MMDWMGPTRGDEDGSLVCKTTEGRRALVKKCFMRR